MLGHTPAQRAYLQASKVHDDALWVARKMGLRALAVRKKLRKVHRQEAHGRLTPGTFLQHALLERRLEARAQTLHAEADAAFKEAAEALTFQLASDAHDQMQDALAMCAALTGRTPGATLH